MRRHFLVLVGFLALAAGKTWPLVLHLGTHLTGPLDPMLLSYVLAWDVHALLADPGGLFDASILYPLDRSLAFSDHLLGLLPIFAPVHALSGNPVLGYNVVLLLSFALSGFAAYALALGWTGAFWPAVLAGLLFGFAPARWADLQHLQILSFFWAPAALLFLGRFCSTRRWGDLGGFALFCWLQVLTAFYLAWLLALAVALYVALHRRLPPGKTAAFLLASLLVLGPLHWPYLEVQSAWGAQRPVAAVTGNSPDLLGFLVPDPSMNEVYVQALGPLASRMAGTKRLFPGLVLPLLALLGLICGGRAVPGPEGRRLRWYCGLLVAGALVLALGPYLIVAGSQTGLPLPYLALHHGLPGWSAMRAPARFVHLAALSACVLAALGARALALRWGWRDGLVCAVLGLCFLAEIGAKPLELTVAPVGAAVPEVYRWLARNRPGPIVEVPAGRLPEFRYTLLGTVHWLPLVNGRTGFYPPAHAEIARALQGLPGAEALEFAGALGIRAAVVHSARLKPQQREMWRGAGLRVLTESGQDRVYEVPQVALAETLEARARATPEGLALELRAPEGRAWRHPRPHGRRPVEVRWDDLAYPVTLRLPVALRPGEVRLLPLRFQPPAGAGSHTLQISIPSLAITTPPLTVSP